MFRRLLTQATRVAEKPARRSALATSFNVEATLLGVLMSIVGCGPEESLQAEYGVVGQAIAEGQVDTDETWLGVIYLRTKVEKSIQLCSGTLVAPNLVVTAMHCIAPLDDGDFQCDYAGNVIQERPGAGELGLPVNPTQIEVRVGLGAVSSEVAARGSQVFSTNSPNICTNDLAFVVLDTELDLPVAQLRLTQKTVLGEALTIVGYGRTEAVGNDTTRRFKENVRVTDLGTDDASNPLSAAPPRTLVVGPSACEGDSGGPAFAPNKTGHGDPNQMVIAGVNSIAIGNCGAKTSRSVFTRLDPFKALLADAFSAAGHTVWEEGQTVPGEKLPEPKPEPKPTKPDESGTSKPRRLTTGCDVQPSPASSSRVGLLSLLVLGYALTRRKTTPTSRR